MAKIGFCAIAGSGMSALAQVLKFKNHDIYGTDRSFDQGKEQKAKQKLSQSARTKFPAPMTTVKRIFSRSETGFLILSRTAKKIFPKEFPTS